jgi:glycosyltransferase involved in cell wall biosynthesis
MNPHDLVTVICLSHNHALYVTESLQSVLNQTYPNIQLIIVDDASTDGSVQAILEFISTRPQITFIQLTKNVGNCQAFNFGLKEAKGEYLIDLAADDMLLPNRIEEGVAELTKAGLNYGVNFSDAELIDEGGKFLALHSDKYPHSTIPQGNVYKNMIAQYFICPPTIMFRKEVIDYLDGYDEALAYEDFDFLVRSSRKFYFCYTPKVLVKRRIVSNSMSSKQFQKGDKQRWSTLHVCEKINQLNQNREEKAALQKRIRYEFLLSMRMLDFRLAVAFLRLYFRLSSPSTMLT